jgi:hypothetical protein
LLAGIIAGDAALLAQPWREVTARLTQPGATAAR